MRKVSFFVVLMLMATSASVLAADSGGSINFSGKVVDKTCTIASRSKSFSVVLPVVSKSALSSVGKVAGRTPFSIGLSECSAGQKVAAYFEPASTVDLNSGRLNNQAASNAAGNVQVQVLGLNNEFLPIKVAGANQSQDNSQWETIGENGSTELYYCAEYYASAAATPGEFSSSVKYTIIYN